MTLNANHDDAFTGYKQAAGIAISDRYTINCLDVPLLSDSAFIKSLHTKQLAGPVIIVVGGTASVEDPVSEKWIQLIMQKRRD